MTMLKGAIFGLCLWIGLLCSTDAIGSSCQLPTMARFRRTIYRPYLGPRTNNYTAGTVLKDGALVVAICKTDVIGDLITKRLVSKCRNGKWRPKLPKCIVNRRCDAPPVIEHATPSENVSPHQTFPHKASITYTCDKDKMATRNSIMVCINGRWTNRNLKCIDRQNMPNDQEISEHSNRCLNSNVINGRIVPISNTYGIYSVICNKEYRPVPRRRYRCKRGIWRGTRPKCVRVKPSVEIVSEQKDECENISVLNGRISTNNVADGVYNVTCYKGYRLIPRQRHKCQAGEWIGTVPKCVRATANCRLHISALRMSYFKSVTTGRMVNPMSVHHMAHVVQICKGQPTRRRKVKCINGRWRPILMTCRLQLPILNRKSVHNRRPKNNENKRQKRSEKSCTIPNVRGGPSCVTISGETKTLMINEAVPDGQKVFRTCLNGGFMLLPGVQMSENITSECVNGNWKPQFPRCLRDISDTAFFDHLPEPGIYYRINVSVIPEPSNISLTISGQCQGFVLKLNNGNVSEHARDVGNISKIHLGSTEYRQQNTPQNGSFVSVYMKQNGTDQFYIERFDGNAICARSFIDYPEHYPDWDHVKGEVKLTCDDLICCKIKCIEYSEFDCKTAYYSKKGSHCTLYDNDVKPKPVGNADLVIVERNDDCT